MLPYAPAPVSEDSRRRLDAAYPMFGPCGLAPFGPQRFLVTSDAEPFLQQFHSTAVHSGDVWVMSLPKCGTTWMQELVWLVTHDCDVSSAQCLLCPDRYQFLELAVLTIPDQRRQILSGQNPVSRRQLASISHRPRPWFVKTHLPLYLCPPTLLDSAKVIYVARNPKDMCVSYFNHLKVFEERDPDMSLERFVDLFITGEVMELPFFPHVLEAWKRRNDDNMLFIFFEDLKKDLRSCILSVAKFLGKQLSDQQVDNLELHLSFDRMKDNKWTNKSVMYAYSPLTAEQLDAASAAAGEQLPETAEKPQFMRRGRVGDWRNHFSQQMNDRMDAWMQRELDGSDLRFVTDD